MKIKNCARCLTVITWTVLGSLLFTLTATAQANVPSGGGVTVFRVTSHHSGSSEYGPLGLTFSPVNRLFGNRNYSGPIVRYAGVQVRATVYSVREMDEQILRGSNGANAAAPSAARQLQPQPRPQAAPRPPDSYSDLRALYRRHR